MARKPYEEANVGAVRPDPLVAFTSAPALTSADTVSTRPSAAAIINGVQPEPPESAGPCTGLLTSTFISINRLIRSVLPADAALKVSDWPDFSSLSLICRMLFLHGSPPGSF